MARHVSSWTEYHPNYASGLELDKLVSMYNLARHEG